jgi:hypothetical protein
MANQGPQKTFNDYSNLIKDLDKKIKNLGGDGIPNLQNFLKAMGNDTALAAKQFALMSREAHDLEDVFGAISTTIKNVVADLDRSTKSTTLFKKGLSSVEGIARKLADHKNDENVLTVKQLGNLNKQLGLEIQNLKIAREKAFEEQKTLQRKIDSGRATAAEVKYSEELANYQKEINSALNLKNSYLDKIVKHAEKEIQIEKEIQKTIGLTGLAFKGIAGTLQKIGVESQAIEDLNKKIRDTAKETGSAWKTAGTAIKGTFQMIGESLKDPAVQVAFITKTFKTLYQIGTEFSTRTFEMQKALGLSTSAATAMNKEFYSMQQSTNNIYANYKDLQTANLNLNESLGTSATFSAETLTTQSKLMQVTGLTAEESAKIYGYSLLNGKTQEQTYNSMGKSNKGVLSNKKVMQEVLKINGQLAAQYKNSPELLGKAVTQAQKLGITLEQAKKMSSGLLNFEDSIAAELEAELLTGQELNLEKARTLALQGKSAEAAAEMLKQTGGLAKFQEMNVLQQEALARSMNMTTDEMADSLVKAEQLEKLGASEKKLLDEKLTALKKAGEFEKASQLEAMALQGKKVELAAQELDTQGKIDKSVSSIKESLKSAIAGPLAAVTDKLAGVLTAMAANPVIKGMLGIAGGAAAILAGVAAGAMAINAAKSIIFGSRGSNAARPMYTKDVGGGAGGGGLGDALGDAAGSLGGGKKASMGKQIKTLFKNPKVMGRALSRLGGGSLMKGLLKTGGKTLLKGAGGIGSILGGLALDGVTANQMSKADELQKAGKIKEAEKARSIGKATDVGSAALTGAGLGATVGSIIPGVGTAIGAGVGGLLGAGYGAYQNYFANPDSAEDFILRPGQKPLKFRKDDIIMGGTGLTGGGAGGGNVEALLKELIVAVRESGNIQIGANKLNEAIGLNLHPMR